MRLHLSRRHALALGLAGTASMMIRPITALSEALQPIRKGYLPGSHGQLHYRIARRDDGSAKTPCICLHKVPFAGRMFEPVMPLLARDRTVIAPDLPGYGDSDPPAAPPSVDDYATALIDVLDRLSIEAADLVGYEAGAAMAVALSDQAPGRVRRLVLIDPPLDGWTPPEPFEIVPAGLHLHTAWERYVEQAMPDWLMVRAQHYLSDAIRRPAISHWGDSAVRTYPLAERMAALTQPALTVDPQQREWGWGFLDLFPTESAALLLSFLDAEPTP